LEQSETSKNRNSLRSLLSNMYWALSSTGFLVLAGFVINIIVGNELGEDLYGVYSLAATIYILVGMVFFVGIPFSLTKYTAEFIDQVEINRQFFTTSVIVVIVATICGGLLLYLLRYILADIFNIPEFIDVIPIIAIGLPFLGLYKTGIARLNGLREMRRMALGDSLRYILFLLLTILFIVILHAGLKGALISLVLSDILVCPYIIWATNLISEWNIDQFKERFLRLGWFGSQVVLARIVEELDVRSSLILVGLFLTKIDISLYSLASMIASAISIIPNAIQKVTGPAMTEFYTTGKIESINSMINQVMKVSAFLLTLIACFLVLFFDNIINFLYPSQPGFLDAAETFQVLAFGAIFYGTTVSISPIFFSMERPDITLKIAIIRVITTVAITLAAIKPLGVIGAAFGGAGTGFIVFGFWIYYIQKLLKIKIAWKSLLVVPIFGFVFVLIAFVLNINISNNLINYLINIIAMGVFSIIIIKYWNLDRYLKMFPKSFSTLSHHLSRK